MKDLAPASDLVGGPAEQCGPSAGEGSRQRPGAVRRDGRCRISTKWTNAPAWTRWSPTASGRELGFDPETTLHDVRYGESYPVTGGEEFVWVFEISGSVPPAHLVGGYAGAVSERQPPMYFRLGGGTSKGISKPGEVVWSRIFVEGGRLKADMGRAKAVELPPEETERRWRITTPQWPMMHAVTGRRFARSVDGAAQVQSHPGGLWAGRGRRQSGAGGQGRHVPRNGNRGQHLRHRSTA